MTTTPTAAPAGTAPDACVVAIDRIHPATNVRKNLGDIEGLAKSIRTHGLLTALTVEPRPDGDFSLKAGYRRLAALHQLGWPSASVVITALADPAARLGQQLAENGERQNLPDLDVADAIQQLLELGVDSADVATTLHTTVDNVDAWRAVASLPPMARELVEAGEITVGDAHHLAALTDHSESLAEALRLIGEGWQVKGAVDSVLREGQRGQRAQREGSAVARLAKEGCRVIEAPKWGQFAGNSKTQRLGQGFGEIHLSKRDHAKQSCHAAYIDREAKIVYCCVNRQRHAGQAGSGVPDLKAERAAKRAERKTLREANATRFREVGDALRNHAFTRDEAVGHVLRLWIETASARTREAAAELLGLAIPDDAGVFAAEKAVRARAAENDEG